MSLVIVAVVANVIALFVGMSDDGAGWVFNFACFLANGFVMPVVALIAAVIAGVQLIQTQGRDVIAWIVMVIAAMAGVAAIWMLLRAIEAVASV